MRFRHASHLAGLHCMLQTVMLRMCLHGVGGPEIKGIPKFHDYSRSQTSVLFCLPYHLSIAGFLVHYGHVGPVEELDQLHHHLCLILVRGNGPCEKRESFRGAQWGARREKAHLKYAKRRQCVSNCICKLVFLPLFLRLLSVLFLSCLRLICSQVSLSPRWHPPPVPKESPEATETRQ